MSDLVKRLRSPRIGDCTHDGVMEEAADEIERLRDALDNIRHMHDGNPSLAMADVPQFIYARYIMSQMRKEARTALNEVK